MNGWTKHRFTPWVPLTITAVAFAVFARSSSGNQVDLANTTPATALLVSLFFFAIALGLLFTRLLIKWRIEGGSVDLLLSADCLGFYALFSVIFYDASTSLMGGDADVLLALLFAVLAGVTILRFFPGPTRVIWSIATFVGGLFFRSAQVNRPDVLNKRQNVASVRAALTRQENGIFCGNIGRPKAQNALYVSSEDRGIVIGPPGTGKTAFMVTQLLDLAQRRGSFVCLDIKPELHDIMREKLIDQGYRIQVFNPTKKIDRYNLLDDLSGITAIGEFAYSLVPSSGSETRAFDEGARDLLDGIISYLRYEKKPVSLPALREFLAQFHSETELIKTLSQCADPEVQDTAFALARSARNTRFIGAVFATLRANLRFLRYGDIRETIERSDFSLSLFLEDAPVALFLQFEERHQQTTELLLSAMISHLFNYFIEHADRAPVLLMLDEIGNVPRIPGLVEKLNTIRSRKLPTWMYWQGIQQMQKYGKQANEGPNSIMAACDFHMAFRLNDNDTARWFSERAGTVDREAMSVNTSTQGGGTSWQTIEEPVLKVADLQSLPSGESVAMYRGNVWRNHATPYFERWPEMTHD